VPSSSAKMTLNLLVGEATAEETGIDEEAGCTLELKALPFEHTRLTAVVVGADLPSYHRYHEAQGQNTNPLVDFHSNDGDGVTLSNRRGCSSSKEASTNATASAGVPPDCLVIGAYLQRSNTI
jgi:hypothetical protein